MKTLLLTLIFCLFNLNSSEIIGKYQIESNRAGDTLELKKDGTFEYESRGDSCYMWSDFSGTWELKNDELTLFHNYSFQEETTEYIEKLDKFSRDFVIFEVTDKNGKPISEFEVKYSINNETQIKKTDKNGIIKFNKYDIESGKNENVGIQIKYLTNGNETSESTTVNGNSDKITLRINDKPKTIEKREKYRFSYKNGILKSIEFPYVEETSTYKKL
ncbi:hypothetical protein [Lacinutrix sp. Bg11-31]|uniref:hypothetical protein n=1 Tax=Lacinutrix sp. Bg11-31 TaxID=2057808 RepID=UPI000C305DA7|nr:hypothetical protein [Lacinutrix sp. Bg11-31]AUC80734.1 hypothetical protein CW733_00710 [Lacinutrix sp. Bg11-31]AUC80741.1 hypothetical protein CW733_00750 [Lacinutrix sp. Bg11-31]